MRDDDIYIHRRPAAAPNAGEREPRSIVRDDDSEQPPERRDS